MLDTVDLTKRTRKTDYKARRDDLEARLGELQRRLRELDIPAIIVFEGWGASGKGTLINRLFLSLDPRGTTVHSITEASPEEQTHPYFWRFWTRTPARGRLAIFDRSWYSRFLIEGFDDSVKDKVGDRAYNEVNAFERQLVDDGCILIKFFLHISPEEQELRFKELESNPSTAWRVTPRDWQKHKQYGKYAKITNAMMARTHRQVAPWTVVEAEDWRYATIKVYDTLIQKIENRLQTYGQTEVSFGTPAWTREPVPDLLGEIDLSRRLPRSEYTSQLRRYQERARDLEHELYHQKRPAVVIYEGWDAAGKGGNMKRLLRRMDPRGYEVIPVAAPNDVELAHHYLWRFWLNVPKAGHIAIFDRSWYGRVLVERIEGLCMEEEWRRAYREINEMEEHLVSHGTIILKFWLHIDRDTQLRRFEDRQRTSHKRWKMTEEDWRNRGKWDLYQSTANEMIYHTNTTCAPWTVVGANDKRYARIKTLKTFCQELERQLK